jgi:hypothetical protein
MRHRGVEYSNLGPPTWIEQSVNGKIGALIRRVVPPGDNSYQWLTMPSRMIISQSDIHR